MTLAATYPGTVVVGELVYVVNPERADIDKDLIVDMMIFLTRLQQPKLQRVE